MDAEADIDDSEGGYGDAECEYEDADASTDAGTETSTDDEPTIRAGRTVAGSVWGDEERDVSVGEVGVRGDVRRSREDTGGDVGVRSRVD